MNWQEVCDDPILQNLPYKLELNRYGEVVMKAGGWNIHFMLRKFFCFSKSFSQKVTVLQNWQWKQKMAFVLQMLLGFLANELWQVEVPCMLQWLQRFASK